MKVILKPKAPYSFDFEWRFHFDSRPQPDTYINKIWRRAIIINNKLIPIRVKSIGTVEKPRLLVEILANINNKGKKELKKILGRIFNIDHNLLEVYKIMNKDPKLKEVKNKLKGLTSPHMGLSIFEGIVRAILQQQLALSVSFMMTELLIRNFGKCIKVKKEEFWSFPSPKSIARTKLSELRKKCKLSQRKAEYIHDFAKKIVKGYEVDRLWKKSDEEIIEELTKIRGVGRWTIELLLVAVMRRSHIVPGADLGIRRTIGRKYFGRPATEEEVRKIIKKWGRFADDITFYLLCEEHFDKRK